MSTPAPARPDQRQWRARRRWLPWRRRIRDVPDVPMLDGGNVDGPIGAILLVIALILAIPALVVIALLLAELLLLVALLPLALLGRMLLPIPWTIELWSRPSSRRWFGWQLERELRVAGWRASAAAIAELRGGREERDPPAPHAQVSGGS